MEQQNEPTTEEIINELKKFEYCNAFPTWALIMARQAIKRFDSMEREIAAQKSRADEAEKQRSSLYEKMISAESKLRRSGDICDVCAGNPELCPFCIKKKHFEIVGLRCTPGSVK